MVTYFDPTGPLCFIEDNTGGVAIAAGTEDRQIQAGQLCRVTGYAGLEGGAPAIDSPGFVVLQPAELPAARPRAAKELRAPDLEGAWVTVQGTVRAAFENAGRVVYRLEADGENLEVVIHSLARSASRAAIGHRVTASGVLHRPADHPRDLRLFSPFAKCVVVDNTAGDALPPVQSVATALGLPSDAPVRLLLTVKDVQPGLRITGKDASGVLEVFSAQGTTLAPGAVIDVTGFMTERDGRKVLEDGSFERVGFIPPEEDVANGPAEKLALLRSVGDIRRLSSEEAERHYPVRLRGVITYYDPDWNMLFFQGASEGIFVKLADQELDLKSGQLVVLKGVTGPGDFAPVIERPVFEILSLAPMPDPKPVTYNQMATGVEDSQWIKTEGIITAVSRQGTAVRLDMAPPTGSGSFMVFLPHLRERTPLDLVGTRVEVEAACATVFNTRRELRGVQLFAPALRFVRILETASGDPFASPPTPIVNLFRFTPEQRTNQIAHIRGLLTQAGQHRLHLEDASGGILVIPESDQGAIKAGETLDVVGFPRQINGATALEKARYKAAPQAITIVPQAMRPATALEEESGLDSRLVEIDALLIETGRTSEALTLLLESDNHLFTAVAPLWMGGEVKSLAPGSRVHLKGVCTLQHDDHGGTLGFRILLRTPDDIKVLSAPDFWNVRRLVIGASALAFFTTAILVWVITLRSRVRKQTTVIRAHLEAQMFLQERFVEFTKHFPGIAFMKTEDGRYAFANDEFVRLAGKDGAELLGKTDSVIWPAAVAERQAQVDQQLLTGQARLDVTDSFDPDGKETWLITRFLINAERGGKRYLCGIGVNITEQKNLEEKLRQVQKMECVGRLAGGVAHDFNNILQVISSYAELIQNAPNAPDTQEFAQEIFQAAARAADLTRQLLMFSRKQVVKKGPIDLNDVSRGMAKMLARIVGEDIALELSLSTASCCVYADRGMLEQVLLNLAVNARDAMPKGGCLRIETTVRHVPDPTSPSQLTVPLRPFVSLKVADTGCGIKPEHLPNIFEPFFTTKEVGRGTGLGLATVYAIVQEHGGSITVDSKVGVGTSFEILLPAGQNVEAQEQSAKAVSPGRLAGSGTILLVEDDATVRKLAARILSDHGYKVVEAESGPAALELARSRGFQMDLAITDMVMPGGIRGIDLCEPLNEVFPDLPIIITSGYAFESAGKLSDLKPNTSFLQKPFLPEDLLASVRSALSGRS